MDKSEETKKFFKYLWGSIAIGSFVVVNLYFFITSSSEYIYLYDEPVWLFLSIFLIIYFFLRFKESQETEDIKETKDIDTRLLYWGIGLGSLFISFVVTSHLVDIYISESPPSRSVFWHNWGTLGDFFGGMLNPLFAFLAFVALLKTMKIQQKEMKETSVGIRIGAIQQEFEQKRLDVYRVVEIYLARTEKYLNYENDSFSLSLGMDKALNVEKIKLMSEWIDSYYDNQQWRYILNSYYESSSQLMNALLHYYELAEQEYDKKQEVYGHNVSSKQDLNKTEGMIDPASVDIKAYEVGEEKVCFILKKEDKKFHIALEWDEQLQKIITKNISDKDNFFVKQLVIDNVRELIRISMAFSSNKITCDEQQDNKSPITSMHKDLVNMIKTQLINYPQSKDRNYNG